MRIRPLLVHVAAAYSGPGTSSPADLEERAILLQELDEFIRKKKELLRREADVYTAQLQPGVELYRALFENHPSMPSDVRKIVLAVLDRCRDLDLSELDQDPPIGRLGLWPAGERFVARNEDWFRFRRETIHLCGVTPQSFIEQVARIFPHLVLSTEFPDCFASLEGGFELFLPTVVRALEALHDKLLPALAAHSIVEGLKRFSTESGFQTTMEGSADRNSALTFNFRRGESTQRVTCAPHMKLSSSGALGDGRFYYNRIYFNPYQENLTDIRIHVGHVGGHL